MKTNRPHFSFQQYSLWNKSKKSYYKKYNLGVEYKATRPQSFGKRFMTMLEEDSDEIPTFIINNVKIPVSIEFEARAKIQTNKVATQLLSYFDGVSLGDNIIYEYKTGKIPYTRERIDKEEQCLFYSVVYFLMYDRVPEVFFYHLETVEMDGDIVFTGQYKLFDFQYTMSDIRRMINKIKNTIIEIYEYEYEEYIVEDNIDERLFNLMEEKKKIEEEISLIKDDIFSTLLSKKKTYGIGEKLSYTVANRKKILFNKEARRTIESYTKKINKIKEDYINDGMVNEEDNYYLTVRTL